MYRKEGRKHRQIVDALKNLLHNQWDMWLLRGRNKIKPATRRSMTSYPRSRP